MDTAALAKEIEGLRQSFLPAAASEDYSRYRDDPVGFVKEVLGERLTPDIERMFEAVRDTEIVIAKSANATGKTHGAARVAIWFYKCFPGAQIYTAAAPPERNLRLLLWGEIGGIAYQHGETLFAGDEVRTLHIERSPREFITGVTIPASGTAAEREAKFSGKHAPNLLFLLDEGDAIPDPVYQGIETCMSGGHVRMLIMYNPRAKMGEVYRMVRDEAGVVVELSAFNHPNVLTGEDVIPGAVKREVVVRRINEYCRYLGVETQCLASDVETQCLASLPGGPGEDTFELPGFLVGAEARSRAGKVYAPLEAGIYQIVEPAFSYMVLARYPAKDTAALIHEEWIREARRRWDDYADAHGGLPPRGEKAVMGLDVADMGDDSNCVVFRFGGFVDKPITWKGVDPYQTGLRAAKEFKIRNVERCCVDAIGVGAGVPGHMGAQGCYAVPVKVSESPDVQTELGQFGILRDQLLWMVREWLRTHPGAMLPPDEMLLEELRVPTYNVDDGKVRIMKKKMMRELLKRSPDRLDALALTFADDGGGVPVVFTGRPWEMPLRVVGM